MPRKPTRQELELTVSSLQREISRCKRAEEALRQSEANYRLLFSAESDAVIVVNAENQEIVDANKAALRVYGYGREELIGHSAPELSTDPRRLADYIKSVASDEPFFPSPGSSESRHKKKDGTVFPVEISSGLYALEGRKMVCIIIRDISERKQAHEALEQSNIAMLDILESISDGFFSLDHQFIVTYFNAAASRLLKKKSWEVLGHSFMAAFPEFKDSVFEEKMKEALNERTSLSFETYLGVAPYDNWFEVNVYSREGGISVFFRATTELKQAEEAQRKLAAQLQQDQKMRAIGALAGGIANDFNNLLSVIQAHASLALLNMDKTHPAFENLKNIERQVQQGARLSAQLLGYAGKGRCQVRIVNINRVVEQTVESFGETRKNMDIQCDLAEDAGPVEADPIQLEQVLWNLLANASDAMPGGGKLLLKTARVAHREMPEAYQRPSHQPDFSRITVTDAGTGIDEGVRDRIFEPFFTTKGSGRRAGLGLTAAYGIVEGHGGFIDFESTQEIGTSFHVYLKTSLKEKDEPQAFDHQTTRARGTVLLVDDDPMILRVGMTLLKTLGYEALVAPGGLEALNIYKGSKDDIDLVILDMIMPDLDGGETYDRIKKINPGVKVLLSTGYGMDGKAAEIMDRGCNGFLQKPFTIDDLSVQIERILSKV
jgi:two-component system cell cycle sensor histidine kinase/response regulator CckA